MEKLIVSQSPHIHGRMTTTFIMGNVLIALCPAFIAAVFYFGPRAALLTLVCVASCVLFEYLSRKIMKRDNTIGDLSAAVTGVLLAFNLPVTIPVWMAVVGCFVAIAAVKQLFGGLGQNFANPALTARIVLTLSFSSQMTNWEEPFYYLKDKTAVMASATPLLSETPTGIKDLFFGNHAGCIGETCALALILGGLYLVVRKIINPVIPAAYMGTVFIFTLLAGQNPIYHMLTGGLMIGAIFMATDYSTSPLTGKGKLIFAIGCGIITAVIRVFGDFAEGVSFAIVIMNILTPVIDRFTMTKALGNNKSGKTLKEGKVKA